MTAGWLVRREGPLWTVLRHLSLPKGSCFTVFRSNSDFGMHHERHSPLLFLHKFPSSLVNAWWDQLYLQCSWLGGERQGRRLQGQAKASSV